MRIKFSSSCRIGDFPIAAVNVSATTLWSAPGPKRKYDCLILDTPNDPAAWSEGMDAEMRLWLVGKVETQVLYGEKLVVLEECEDWFRVAAVSQGAPECPYGYPGWIPAEQLSADNIFLDDLVNKPLAAVLVPHTCVFCDAGLTHLNLDVSYQTRLPLLGYANGSAAVRLPDGATGFLPPDTFIPATELKPDIGVLLKEARMFLGLRYVWGGTTAYGFDCSGFTMRLFESQGISIPRDADAQSTAGLTVNGPDTLEPGDLVFFATEKGRGDIHHVALYAGNGLMIHAPNSRSAVREQLLTDSPYREEYWGARRILPLTAK